MIISQLNILRNKSGLNVKQVAERADISYSTVQKIFNGETQSPNVDHVFKIVTAMGYTMNDLYATPNAPNKEDATLSIIREMYEHRISDLKEQHRITMEKTEQQHKESISLILEAKAKHGKTYKVVLSALLVFVVTLSIFFAIYFAMDYSNKDWGIFFRDENTIEEVVTEDEEKELEITP